MHLMNGNDHLEFVFSHLLVVVERVRQGENGGEVGYRMTYSSVVCLQQMLKRKSEKHDMCINNTNRLYFQRRNQREFKHQITSSCCFSLLLIDSLLSFLFHDNDNDIIP